MRHVGDDLRVAYPDLLRIVSTHHLNEHLLQRMRFRNHVKAPPRNQRQLRDFTPIFAYYISPAFPRQVTFVSPPCLRSIRTPKRAESFLLASCWHTRPVAANRNFSHSTVKISIIWRHQWRERTSQAEHLGNRL